MVREAVFLRNAVRPDSVGGSAIFAKIETALARILRGGVAPFSETSCKFSKHFFFKTSVADVAVGFGV